MNKILSVISIAMVIFMFAVVSPAMANGEENGNGGGGDKITVKDNNVLLGRGNTGIQGNKNHHNIVVGGDVNLGEGAGADNSVDVDVEGGDATAYGGNVYFGGEEGGNVLSPEQHQGQQQGQNQGQSMGDQKNKQVTKIEITEAENKRDHLTGPPILRSAPNFRNGQPLTVKTVGWGLLNKIGSLTWAQASRLGKGASDFKVEEALLFKNSFRTAKVYKLTGDDTKGIFMGYLYLLPEGGDVNAAAGIGRIGKAAMKAGATHFKVVMEDAVEEAEGSAWNIGFGGGASLLSSGDKIAIAPNGGLGYGKARTSNEMRPAAAVELYFDGGSVVAPEENDFQGYTSEN